MDELLPLATLTPLWPPKDHLRPALFLDRDDTLIWNVPYLNDPAKVRLMPGAAEGLRCFREAGWRLVLISNQSGVGRGYFTVQELSAVQSRVAEVLSQQGVQLDGCYCCPHAPESRCDCRKPHAGMFVAAQRDFAIDMARSVMIGDKRDDVLAGHNAGLRSIQLLTTPEAVPCAEADAAVHSILEAAKLPWVFGS